MYKLGFGLVDARLALNVFSLHSWAPSKIIFFLCHIHKYLYMIFTMRKEIARVALSNIGLL